VERGQETRKAGRLGNDDRGYVLVVASAQGGEAPVLALPREHEAVLGRESPADIVLADDSVSRRHALVRAGSPPTIEDLGSTNGTKVMGRTLARGERAPLSLGTVVEIGTVVAVVQPASMTDARAQLTESRGSGLNDTAERMTLRPPGGAKARAAVPGARSVVLEDATMLHLYELVRVIAPSRLSILVLGETGVGKDVYAETVHAQSPRAGAPFVRLNCAALPENLLEAELFGYERGAFTGAQQAKPGLFESADGGTVFLDEIGEMTLSTQAKILRVLESGEVMRIGSVRPKNVDVRFIAATNRDLEALASVGQFRSDLYFRLNGVSVVIPPLRRRAADIVPLAKRFLAESGTRSTLGDVAIERLRAHRWPGNIRELKNVIERAALLAQGGVIQPEHLLFGASTLGGGELAPVSVAQTAAIPAVATSTAPAAQPRSTAKGPIRDELADVERTRILAAMEQCGGNQSRVAKMLGISRTTLIKRLEAYGHVRPRKGRDE
jgi:two-component system, NtrC family, response regulator AtoC